MSKPRITRCINISNNCFGEECQCRQWKLTWAKDLLRDRIVMAKQLIDNGDMAQRAGGVSYAKWWMATWTNKLSEVEQMMAEAKSVVE
jgi:hypothetical protein